MSPAVGQRAPAILRWAATIVGLMLILVECFDAMVTPRPDWIWFGAAALLMWLSRRSHRAGGREIR